MKKQIISFCALFGLVLVLSVYYVVMPTNAFEVNSNVPENALDVNYTINQASNLTYSKLHSSLEEKHNKAIYSCEEIIASANYENEVKEAALNDICNEQMIMDNEALLVSKIMELGYTDAYCEYHEDIIKVLVQADTLSNVEAANIITIVMTNLAYDCGIEIEYSLN